MCVFDHQQDRLAGRQAIKDPAHHLDHLPLTRCPVRVRHEAQPRKQRRECRAAAQDLAAPLLIRLIPQGTQGFHDRPERQCALTDVQAAAAQDPEPQTRGGAGHILYQPGLADTGVAPHGDQHHLAAGGTFKHATQKFPLALPSDQYRAGHPGAHSPTIPKGLLAGQYLRRDVLSSSPYVRGPGASARGFR